MLAALFFLVLAAPVQADDSAASDQEHAAPNRGQLSFDEFGNALRTQDGVTTQLEPEEFYRLVGHEDRAQQILNERSRKTLVAGIGVGLMGVGAVALIADFLYVAAGICDSTARCEQPNAPSYNGTVAGGIAIGGLISIGLGIPVAIVGLALPVKTAWPDAKDLAAGYNQAATQSEPPADHARDVNAVALESATRSSLLQTLRVAPLGGNGTRGVALGLAF